MQITDEVVDRAYDAFRLELNGNLNHWSASERDAIRAALEAALPHLLGSQESGTDYSADAVIVTTIPSLAGFSIERSDGSTIPIVLAHPTKGGEA